MVDFFKKTELDVEFYNKYIKDRLPDKIIDMHLHISNEHIRRNWTPDMTDWSNQCAPIMSADDYKDYAKVFYPDAVSVECNALPSCSKGVDIEEGDVYLADLKKQGKIRYCCMLTDPKWTGEFTEELMLKNNIDGFKPYPDVFTGKKGAEIGMFDYINPDQFALMDKYNKLMVLHLPRAGRMPDENNYRELCKIREKYPNIRISIAHCGRCYAIGTLKRAYEEYGSLFSTFQYDLAAVLNPLVIDFMFEHVPHNQIMYGTDQPIFLWHGKRRWTDETYHNLVREDFEFNKHEEGAEAESKYTFFVYEQLKNILDVCDKYEGKELAQKIFYQNAVDFFEKK